MPWTLLESMHAQNVVELMYVGPDETVNLQLLEDVGGVVQKGYSNILQMERNENYPGRQGFLDPSPQGSFSDRTLYGRRIYVPRK